MCFGVEDLRVFSQCKENASSGDVAAYNEGY